MRIVSLLPSATEIVYALGLQNSLLAVTHECDFPVGALSKAKITKSVLPEGLSSKEIDEAINGQITKTGSPYTLNFDLLRYLTPDLIFTQKLCSVCAVSYDQVAEAVKTLPNNPTIINLEPTSLSAVFAQIEEVAELTGVAEKGKDVVTKLKVRVEDIVSRTHKASYHPQVLFLEWLEPPYVTGHWMPELIRLAGGEDWLSKEGKPSVAITWKDIFEYDPEKIIVGCCGFGIERAAGDFFSVLERRKLHRLSAVRNGQLYITDGKAYFSRPGPRLVDSLEILAAIFHPEMFVDLDVKRKFARFPSYYGPMKGFNEL